jgi:nicotinamide mononucleotide adenylyltransferase
MTTFDGIVSEGSAHGRFQPFHNEHLAYVTAAHRSCKFLWIGITKYDLDAEVSPLGREREKPENNPLTYFERISIIADALNDVGIPRSTFAFIPFPIEHPHKLRQFLSTSVVCFTTICESWNREKIGVLKAEGYTVTVLWEREKSVTGQAIREQIANGEDTWRRNVPLATARAIEKMDLAKRLRRLRERSPEK